MFDPKYIQIAQNNIRNKIKDIDQEIAEYMCTLTHQVKEHDWDDPKAKTPAQFIDMCDRISRFERLRKTGYI